MPCSLPLLLFCPRSSHCKHGQYQVLPHPCRRQRPLSPPVAAPHWKLAIGIGNIPTLATFPPLQNLPTSKTPKLPAAKATWLHCFRSGNFRSFGGGKSRQGLEGESSPILACRWGGGCGNMTVSRAHGFHPTERAHEIRETASELSGRIGVLLPFPSLGGFREASECGTNAGDGTFRRHRLDLQHRRKRRHRDGGIPRRGDVDRPFHAGRPACRGNRLRSLFVLRGPDVRGHSVRRAKHCGPGLPVLLVAGGSDHSRKRDEHRDVGFPILRIACCVGASPKPGRHRDQRLLPLRRSAKAVRARCVVGNLESGIRRRGLSRGVRGTGQGKRGVRRQRRKLRQHRSRLCPGRSLWLAAGGNPHFLCLHRLVDRPRRRAPCHGDQLGLRGRKAGPVCTVDANNPGGDLRSQRRCLQHDQPKLRL